MTAPFRILHLEDNARDAQMVRDLLEAGRLRVEVTLVGHRRGFEDALAATRFDLIVSDYNLPDYDGIAAVKLARERQPDTPVIVVSGTVGEEEAVKALQFGATDYLLKTRLERLVPAVKRALDDAANKRRQRETEAELRDSEVWLSLASDAAHLAFWQWNPATDELTGTPEFTRLYGLGARRSIPYAEWAQKIHPDDLARAERERDRAIAERRPFEFELRVAGEAGDTRWIYGRASAVFDSAGRLTHVVGANMDVTERKTLEAQFRHAQKMEAVGRLAGSVAHDFNNLLTVISGEAELANLELPADHPVRAALDQIRETVDRGVALTRQLLVFSRQEKFEPTTFDVAELLGTAERLLRRLIKANIRFEMRVPPDAGSVRMDRGSLEQVLVNLVVNARDAMPNGGVLTISVARERRSDPAPHDGNGRPGDYVRISVGDTGSGMSAEVKARLFEPFFTTKPAGKGTGLGLSTCYGIAQEAGGHIEVDSEPGVGTTMKVYLPLAPAAQRDVAEHMSGAGQQGTA